MHCATMPAHRCACDQQKMSGSRSHTSLDAPPSSSRGSVNSTTSSTHLSSTLSSLSGGAKPMVNVATSSLALALRSTTRPGRLSLALESATSVAKRQRDSPAFIPGVSPSKSVPSRRIRNPEQSPIACFRNSRLLRSSFSQLLCQLYTLPRVLFVVALYLRPATPPIHLAGSAVIARKLCVCGVDRR